jgi:pseudaminic acid synthase
MIKIGNSRIGITEPPFIIAEMSGNHNQSLERALEIVDMAAKTGAHALKIQTYTPDTMTLDLDKGEFHINDSNSLWSGTSLYKLYGMAQTPWEWHKPIFSRAIELGMIPFSTPFDESAVDFLETLNVPCYKIASFENTDLQLIRRVAATGKPVFISTGMATLSDLDDIVKVSRESGCKELILLKCTSAYPAMPEDANILTIPHLRELFGCEVGLSDHTMGIGVSLASVALGATVIEKHFTLDRSDGGVDSTFSMEPPEMAQLVIEAKRAWHSIGKVNYSLTDSEKKSMIFRRSLYIVKDMRAGDVLSTENLKAIRPGFGLAPKHLTKVIGKSVTRDVDRGTPLNWDFIK